MTVEYLAHDDRSLATRSLRSGRLLSLGMHPAAHAALRDARPGDLLDLVIDAEYRVVSVLGD